jgi:hypothetical protein
MGPLAASEGKIIIGAILAFSALAAMIIYLPVAIVREVIQSEDEPLPEWMGTVRGRRARMRVMIGFVGCLAIAIAAAVWLTE